MASPKTSTARIVVSSTRPSFRRAGKSFGPKARVLTVISDSETPGDDSVTESQAAVLKAEPMLVVVAAADEAPAVPAKNESK